MIKSPCKNCPDRALHCHSICRKYKQYSIDVTRERHERQEREAFNRSFHKRNSIRKKLEMGRDD